MRILAFHGEQVSELQTVPKAVPPGGFLWIGVARDTFETRLPEIQGHLHRLTGGALVDLHVSDLVNRQLPSHFDYTSWYDLVVFRRLVAAVEPQAEDEAAKAASASPVRVTEVETSAVGFAVFDRVLVTVHHAGCSVREYFAQRLLSMGGVPESRAISRLPLSPADLMLRMVNHMVDNYLDLRRQLTRKLGHLQQLLLDPRSRFNDWHVLLEARTTLNLLEDICEDQRSAIQEWIDAIDEWPDETDAAARRERELLRVRSRDVLEHVERVLGHVRRLEESAEASVQMHFSALGHRTNEIMRTLTVLTAIFLPLNLITGFFGMNFDSLPLIHSTNGLWIAFVAMVALGVGLVLLFRRKRYLDTD